MRLPFGGTSADAAYSKFVNGSRVYLTAPVDANGRSAPVTLTFYDAETGGNQITDLSLDAAGTQPVSSVTIPAGSVQVPSFYGPDGVTELWAEDGDGNRALMVTRSRPSTAADVGAADVSRVQTLEDLTNTGRLSQASQTATFAKKPRLLDGGLPPIFAHRGGGIGLYPGSSQIGMDASAAIGVGLEYDIWTLPDGGLVLNHDVNVDTITGGSFTGRSDSYLTNDFLAVMQIKDGVTGYGPQPFQTFGQTLKRYGGRVVLMPEDKSGTPATTATLCDRIIAAGLEASTLVQGDLDTVVAKGCIAAPFASTSTDPVNYYSRGARYAVVDGDAITAAWVTSAHAVGLKVIAYSYNTFNTRKRKADMLAKGIDSLIVDDAAYLSRTTAMPVTNPWKTGVALPGIPGAGKPYVGKWGYNDNTSGIRLGIHGWACPVPDNGNGYQITVDFEYDTLSTDQNGALHVWAAMQSDNPANDTANGQGYNGYQFSQSRSGYLQVMKWINGSQTGPIASGSTALAADVGLSGTTTMQIKVTPTAVSMQRMTGGTFNPRTANDTAFRGGYIGFGANGTSGYFKNLSIAAL